MRLFLAIMATVLAIALGGCGIVHQREMQQRAAALKEQSAAAMQACEAKFPKGNISTAVVRAQCANDALAIQVQLWPYPDLFSVWAASHIAIAERVQKGQITIVQANEELANKWSAIVAEEQRRLLANRSVAAQETTAQNIGGPTSCTRYGNTVTCF